MSQERRRIDKGSVRSELVTIRFDPRTKYLMELAARTQHRSTANFVEWAVAKALDEVKTQSGRSVQEAMPDVWDVDPQERIKKLAAFDRSLLTFDEEVALR